VIGANGCWVDVHEQPVSPEADTIIRTLTRTVGEHSWSSTYWLESLRAPAMLGPGSDLAASCQREERHLLIRGATTEKGACRKRQAP
jgi:hypothetical protein